MEGYQKPKDQNSTPAYSLMDGGSLWSSIRFGPQSPLSPPLPTISPMDLLEAAAIVLGPRNYNGHPIAIAPVPAAHEEVSSGVDIRQDQDQARLTALKLARKQSRSPELFEELMLGKRKKQKVNRVQANGSNRRRKQSLDTRMEEDYVECETSEDDHQYHKSDNDDQPCSTSSTSVSTRRTATAGPSRPSSQDANTGELPSTVLEEFFPKGYDPYRRRSDRLEARALQSPRTSPGTSGSGNTTGSAGRKLKPTVRGHQAQPSQQHLQDRRAKVKRGNLRKMSVAKGFNVARKKPSLQVLAELLLRTKSDARCKGRKTKKRYGKVPRRSSKWQAEEEEEDEGVISDDENDDTETTEHSPPASESGEVNGEGSDHSNDGSMANSDHNNGDAVPGPSNGDNLENLVASKLSIDQLIVCLGLFKNDNQRLEEKIEAAKAKIAEAETETDEVGDGDGEGDDKGDGEGDGDGKGDGDDIKGDGDGEGDGEGDGDKLPGCTENNPESCE